MNVAFVYRVNRTFVSSLHMMLPCVGPSYHGHGMAGSNSSPTHPTRPHQHSYHPQTFNQHDTTLSTTIENGGRQPTLHNVAANNSTTATTRDQGLGQPHSKALLKGTRSRTGCLTCRKRKVKCDERGPVCKRCEIGEREVSSDYMLGVRDPHR